MARAGVTYHDVAKAAEAIKSQRQEPTVDRVREHLGTGSKSTIAPLLKRWRSDNGEAVDTGGLPNDLIEVVKSLHERVQQMADHRIEQARQEFEGFNQELRKELTDAKNTIVQLTARQQDLDSQIERQNKEKGEAEKSLEDARVSLVKAESQRDEAIARTTELKGSVAELKGSVAELKQENKDIREHFEHYQQRTAEDRQQEREQFRTITQGLKDQIRDLQHRLTQAESKASELSEANAQLHSNVGKLEQANVTLNRELNGKIEDIQDLKRDLEDAVTKYRDFQHKNEQLVENMAVITTQKVDVDKQVAVLSQALETAKAERKASQDKIAFLTDENKVILQEKALIQGQFKQLQDSL